MKILIAVDGSVFTRKALDYLIAHRAMFLEGQELVVVHVCTGVPGNVARHVGKELLNDYYAEESAKVIGPVEALLAERSITGYVLDRRHGHAAEEIIASAKAHGAGMIVMGTHGHGIFGRALLGSVTTKVIAEADMSVLLVQ